MKQYHKADYELAKWIDTLAEDEISKLSAEEQTILEPYGFVERSNVYDEETEEVVASMSNEDEEEKQDENDLEQRIDEAKSPEELEEIEKEVGGEEPPQEGQSQDEQEQVNELEESIPEEGSPGVDPKELDEIKNEMKQLKEKMNQLTGEEKMQHEIDVLKRRLNDLQVPDDADLSDSIFQSASIKVAHIKREIRRFEEKLND